MNVADFVYEMEKEIVHLQNERKSVRVLQVINKTVRDHPVYKKTRDKSCNLRSVRCWSYLFSVRYRYDLQEMSLGVSTVRHLLFLENSFSFSRGTELARIKRKRKKGEDGTDRKSSSL